MFFGTVYSQQVPGKEQSQSILISNGTIHVGNGDLLENAFVGFDNGKINYVSTSQMWIMKSILMLQINIYPGFIPLLTRSWKLR